MPRRLVDGLFLAYLAVCAACLVWPGMAWFAGRAEPLVLGLPFPLFWSAAWIVATFGALVLYHRMRGDRG